MVINDDPTYRNRGNPKRHCRWFANESTASHCKINGNKAYGYCPETCGNTACVDPSKCMVINADPTYRRDNKSRRTCAWVKTKPQDLCILNNNKAYDYCSEACGNTACIDTSLIN
jgi:hypothetical protein